MKIIFLFFLLAALPGGSFAQSKTDKRLAGLEIRVTRVEKRVTKLEKGAPQGQAAPAAVPAKNVPPADPLSAVFIKKKQVAKGANVGIRLYFEIENVSNRRFYAFNGTLVFKDADGGTIWEKDYAYSEPLNPGEKLQLTLFITGEHAKEYLKFVKAREITLSFEKQEAYGEK